MGNIMMASVATLVGMGGVFIILFILTGTTWALNEIVDKMDKTPEPAKKGPAAPAPVAAPAAPVAAANNNAKIAAIMAAVTAAMGTSEVLKFNAIQRTGGSMTSWSAAGNSNLMQSRARYTEGGNK